MRNVREGTSLRLPSLPLPRKVEDRNDLAGCRRLARQHGWTQAAARQRQYLANHLVCLQGELASLVNALEVPRQAATFSSVTEIYRDICSLNREFDKVVWDLRCKTLSIHTEPISLEGIYLGPFEIQLDILGMPDSDCYRVIALDPQPAESPPG